MKIANPIYDVSVIEKRDTEILMREKQLAEQKTQLAEKDSMLRVTIKMLKDSGQTIENIAKATGLSAGEIEKL